jgi:uncharacterized protein YpmS
MVFDHRKLTIILALAAFVLASLACNLPAAGRASSPTPTDVPVPVSTEAVESLEDQIRAAATQASQGEVASIVVTEEQLTSLVAFELKDKTEPALTNPQVYLRSGQIELHGDVKQSGLTLPLKMVMTVSVNAQGQADYDIVSANLGPVELPDSMLDALTRRMDASLASINAKTEDLEIESIVIDQGKMTITGRRRS